MNKPTCCIGLDDTTLARIIDVFKEHSKIAEVILYGSRAKGNYKPGSDIDLTFIGKELTLHELNGISLALDDLLLPFTFDLSIYSQIDNTELIGHIKRVGITIYKKAEESWK